MLCDCLVFPVRPATYKKTDFKCLIEVPRPPESKFSKKFPDSKIPVRLYKISGPTKTTKSNLLILYFHGNAEDIGNQSRFLATLHQRLGIHLASIEYPGYGRYEGKPGYN